MRFFDIILTIPTLLALSPFYFFIAVGVRLSSRQSILFIQTRPGLNGRPFKLLKFRTMTDACDSEGNLLPDAMRLTRFGRFLRSTSLDELPELINIIKGDMSIVGPRPLLMRYLDRYTPDQARRHEVKPGLTGWAQIHGRNTISWEEKFKLDVWYIDHRSLWLDIKVIALTAVKVFQREGINHDGEATMGEFLGSETK